MEMVDLHSQYHRLKKEIDTALLMSVEECNYINGPQVAEFSANLSNYLNVPHVVSCANGTDALQLALMALELNAGDEVITTSFSFVASAEVIALLGLVPVFADVCPGTFNIDINSIEDLITSKTKAILPVHLFGQSCDMNRVMAVAKKHKLFVIEDVAQSLGAEYFYNKSSVKLGTIGHIGCTSFFPSKNLGCFGDGGACFTADSSLADKMKVIAGHGSKRRYYHDVVGINSRLDTIQAAILKVKLNHLNDFIERRQRVAEQYNRLLGFINQIEIPQVQDGAVHTYNQYTIKVKNGKREMLINHLANCGIPARVYYPLPLHSQLAFKKYVNLNIKLPVSEALCNQVLSLPMHTEMNEEMVTFVANEIISFFTDANK